MSKTTNKRLGIKISKEELLSSESVEDFAKSAPSEQVAPTSKNQKKNKGGRPRLKVSKFKKTISMQVTSQTILDYLRAKEFEANGRKPSEGEIIDMALLEKAKSVGFST